MKDAVVDNFQFTVQELLVRNKSILDSITKFQDATARVNRSIVKAATHCGCIKINAGKQDFPEEENYETLRDVMKTHIEGKLCDNCRDTIEKETGGTLFYLAALCNALDLNLYDIILKETEQVKLLGKFNLR